MKYASIVNNFCK